MKERESDYERYWKKTGGCVGDRLYDDYIPVWVIRRPITA